jgi:hypothetical protein
MSNERDLPERMIECLPASIVPPGKNVRSLGDGLGDAVGASETDGDGDGEAWGAPPTFPPPPGKRLYPTIATTTTAAAAIASLANAFMSSILRAGQSGRRRRVAGSWARTVSRM